jgi:hypothetical protein
MGKNKKSAKVNTVKAPIVDTKVEETKVETVETSATEVKAPVVVDKPADVKKPVITKPEVKKPQVKNPEEAKAPAKPQKVHIPSVKPEVLPLGTVNDKSLRATDMIALAGLNQTAIRENLLGDTPELAIAMRKQHAISLVAANVLVMQEMRDSGLDKKIGIVLKDEDVSNFLEACVSLGITGVHQLENKADPGQTEIDFTNAEVPVEVEEAAKVENKVLAKPKAELDPTKITDKEMLLAAVNTILTREFVGETRKTGKKTNAAENFVAAMGLISSVYYNWAETDAAKAEVKAQDAAHWANEVILLTTTLPLSIVATCRTLHVNTVSSCNLLPAHAVFSTMTKSLDLSDEIISKIVPILVTYVAKDKTIDKKQPLDFDLAVKSFSRTNKSLVEKLSTPYLDSLSEAKDKNPDKIYLVSYRTTRGIVSSNYFTKEARELPTFEETFLKKVGEIASFYETQFPEPVADKKK